jgi:hypothetical protein
MATSPIYSWPEPDNTDLVKNGALAIRTLGNAIDTTMGTMVAKTIIDAKGDLIAGTAADTAARLAVGANNTVLTADSAEATGMKWAAAASGGGMTLISTTALTGASVTLSSIPQTYTHLQIYVAFVKNDTANGSFRIAPNGGTNYVYMVKNYNATSGGEAAAYIPPSDSYDRTNDTNFQHYNIYNYATDTGWKTYDGAGGFFNAGGYRPFQNGGYIYTAGAALSSLVISNSGGNLSAGTIYLYGVK